jgi:hypothetical protein
MTTGRINQIAPQCSLLTRSLTLAPPRLRGKNSLFGSDDRGTSSAKRRAALHLLGFRLVHEIDTLPFRALSSIPPCPPGRSTRPNSIRAVSTDRWRWGKAQPRRPSFPRRHCPTARVLHTGSDDPPSPMHECYSPGPLADASRSLIPHLLGRGGEPPVAQTRFQLLLAPTRVVEP